MDNLDVELEKPSGKPKILIIAISILAIALIVGGVTWYYLNNKSVETATTNNEKNDSTDTTTSDSDASQISTNLASTIQQINNELAAMAADGSSTEDEVPTL